MKWSLLALAAVLSLSGCQNRQPVVNPFMGPTVVAPPATGAAAPGTAPYYQGSPPPGSPPPAYSPPGGLPPSGAYNPQATPPSGNVLPTVPGTIQGTPPPTYAPPAGSNNYRQSAPGGSNTQFVPTKTDAFASRAGTGNVRVASSDVVYLDESIPVSPTSAKSKASSLRTVGGASSNEPSIKVPTDSKPDRLQMEPVGGIRRVSYDAPSAPSGVTRPNGQPLFAPPPLPYQNRRSSTTRVPTPARSIVRPSTGRPTPARPPTAQSPVIRAPVAQPTVAQPTLAQRSATRPPANYRVGGRATPRSRIPEPRRFVQPPAMVEISDLPPAGTNRSATRMRGEVARQPIDSRPVESRADTGTSSPPQSRVSSYVASPPVRASNPQPTPAVSSVAEPAKKPTPSGRLLQPAPQPSPRYGRAPDYSWVTGKLEYSRTKQQWKLRYIPIDGETDKYGGSVLISNAEALQAFEAGDYVALRGSIGKSSGDSRSFAPKYQVSRAKALSN